MWERHPAAIEGDGMGTTVSQIIRAVAACERESIDFTKNLISVATENPPGRHYQKCIELIAEKLSGIGLECTTIEVPSGGAGADEERFPRFCLVSNFGDGRKTIYFHGHYDVVPAFRRQQFTPYVRDGRLFGRGSSDMKSGLAAMIYAVKALQMCKVKLNGRICLTFVPDEETGGVRGSQYLSEIGLLGKDGVGMLLPEPTGGVVWDANRGAVSIRITVKGRFAHVGQQYRGVNAFERMLVVAGALQKLKHEVESRTTNFRIEPAEAKNSILMIGGLCRGGAGFNIVPEEMVFTVDRRINPEEELEAEKHRLLECLESVKTQGVDLDVELLQEGASSGISEDIPLAQSLSKNIHKIMGRKPAFEMCPGLLEIRFYAQKGVPALAFGPEALECSHGPDEFVEVKNIGSCAAVYALTAFDLLAD
jgi:acetylornithine deacetylase/succinyl-diaminopimelate desuccinylase family protein